MIRLAFFAFLVLTAEPASADTETQSDWSGGPGTPGPVLTWGSDYSSDSGSLWFATPGCVCLATGVECTIDADFEFACSICSGDVDGDGVPDIIGAADQADDITWWNLDAHRDTGSMESSILYLGCDPDWGTILWTDQTPSGTSVSFQVRASDDFLQMGDWSDTIVSPCSLHGILEDDASYFQYRVFLTTADPDTTPTLLDVTVTWNPLGTGEGESPSSIELQPFSPNPCSGPVVVRFGLPSATSVDFSVFDVSGRVVAVEPAAEYPAGLQQIQIDELAPGIYFIRMRAGEFEAVESFVVVE